MNSRLKRLWEDSQVCYWCGRQTHIYRFQPGAKLPDDTATLDHIFPVNHPMRTSYKNAKQESPCVLACLRCNNERGNRSFSRQKQFAIERYPKGTPNAKAMALDRLRAAEARPAIKPKQPNLRLLRDRRIKLKGFKK